jgi:hypothetical protein
MRALGAAAPEAANVFFTGGSSAVLLQWRGSTIDVDLKIEPDAGSILRAIPALKETLEINVELASPGDFIPELPGWRERSPWIATEGLLTFRHYDFYAQALAKIERWHARDRSDVSAMFDRHLIDSSRLLDLFASIEAELFRYPAIDPPAFRRAVESATRELGRS